MLTLLFSRPGHIYILATLLPLLAFVVMLVAGLIRGLAGYYRPTKIGAYFCTTMMVMSAILAIEGLHRACDPLTRGLFVESQIDWVTITSNSPSLHLGYRIDMLTAILFAMVTVIATLIFIFSLGYMKEELQEVVEDHEAHVKRRGRFGRFYLFLSLFVFAMLNLLIADNLLQVFVSWELVGLCSFFLIGFYGERKSAGLAANKAFIMNRIGDAGFLMALAIVWSHFGTFDFNAIFYGKIEVSQMPTNLATVMGLGLFFGCVGKSAQFPLHTWLPDAMEGPTPVSALIHAATMVAAGVYLVGRCYQLFTPDVLLVIAYTGAFTAFMAATIAVAQNDIKRVLAYSTVSQLGYMMLALGVGGWVAGMMHLVTHAFFKALLFLGAGSVILGCHHEQDLRKMGGLRHKMPVTAYTMLVGVLAIVGTPLFSGWYSKELILASAHKFGMDEGQHPLLFLMPMLTIALTAFYMFRMWFLAFAGHSRTVNNDHETTQPSWLMKLPLIVLAIPSIGIAWGPLKETLDASAPNRIPHAPHWVEVAALAMTALGSAAAWWLFVRKLPWALANEAKSNFLHRFFLRKWYFDELYAILFLRPMKIVAEDFAKLDKSPAGTDAAKADQTINPGTLDGLWNALGLSIFALGVKLKRLQTGKLREYVLMLVLTSGLIFAILSLFGRYKG